ncbi:hypothetical protein NE237_002780 [Protea cynaroides]|uniref:Josephin-like protein n=1 Tax=Protea cynaroides TaxID=273540 RepID=A0A9Q0KG50_9MAGN|nr:hypothetical protein NE237_002780 [Protea cynaroides]
MLRSAIKGVSMSPGINDSQKFSLKESSSNSAIAGNKKGISRFCNFLVLKNDHGQFNFSPMRYLKLLGAKVARAIRLVSVKRATRMRFSSKVSSSNSTRSSRPSVAQLDSHQTEAIEDCIQYFNSPSSFQRSNSLSSF